MKYIFVILIYALGLLEGYLTWGIVGEHPGASVLVAVTAFTMGYYGLIRKETPKKEA